MAMINQNKNEASHFWDFDMQYWISSLSSSIQGLTAAQVSIALLKHTNVKKTKTTFQKDLLLFIRQFKSPLMILLIGAVILSAFLGDNSDVYIILFIVLSTGLLSFFQERNASRVVEKLQSMIAIKCNVIRDGQSQEIDTKTIVPGDVLLLSAGDMVPADCLLMECKELHVNESSLTGESFPVRKEVIGLSDASELTNRTQCLWEGTSVVSGTAKALVINTGENTIFGSIAKSASNVIETSFEKGIKRFGYFLMIITLILSVFIMAVNLSAHKSIIDSALFALALAVGMAPELLPAITTIAMSAGAKRMLEKKVIVKKLASIQNLGEVNLLCTDKTGTITEGVITVKGLVDVFGVPSLFVQKIACWNANLQTGYGNPIDDTLKRLGMPKEGLPLKLDELPYDFTRKRISILVNDQNNKTIITKGAFNEILSICTWVKNEAGEMVSIESYKDKLVKAYELYGINGYRTIAICYKDIETSRMKLSDESHMIFAGFIQLEDPIKLGITDTIDALNNLSVQLKIITGDNKNIAMSIAQKIGIQNPILLTGKEITTSNAKDLIEQVSRTHIFAEVEPQQKEQIIQLLRQSYTVAYIGDGINDVSAINVADVGISVNNAVDIAKEAADFVLLEKDLMVIVDGIKEGRKTFANTLKYIFINTGSTFGNMFSVAIASLILPFLPMLPKQILLTNFITDFPYLSISSDNVDNEQLEKPGKWNLKIIRNYMIIFGLHSSIFDVITFSYLIKVLHAQERLFQTGWFVESVLTQLLILFIIRSHQHIFKSIPSKSLVILSILAIALTIALPYMPMGLDIGLVHLPLNNLMAMFCIVLLYIITADIIKVWFFKNYKAEF